MKKKKNKNLFLITYYIIKNVILFNKLQFLLIKKLKNHLYQNKEQLTIQLKIINYNN